MTELFKNVAVDAANAAIEVNPEKIAADKALGFVDPSLQKQFDQTVSADNLLQKSGVSGAALSPPDAAITPTVGGPTKDLGWVNGFRAWLTGRNVGLTYKQTYIDPITESITNNKVIVMSDAIVKNAVTDAAQSAAETMGLVSQTADGEYEQILNLDPKVLDERIDNLNNLLKDKTVQKDIGDAAESVMQAAQEPIEKAQHQLVEISAKMVEDVGEQGALALGNALKVLPVVGNALSALGAIQNLTDVVATTAKGAKEALNVSKDLTAGIQLNLEEETVKTLLNDPTKKFELGAAFEAYKSTINDLVTKETREIEELKKKVESNNISTDDKNVATIDISKKERNVVEYKSKLDKWLNDPNTKAQLDDATNAYKEKQTVLTNAKNVDIKAPVKPFDLPIMPTQVLATNGGGVAKSRKRRAHANKQTLKRISDCLNQHFSKTKCVPRKSHTKKKRKHIKHINK